MGAAASVKPDASVKLNARLSIVFQQILSVFLLIPESDRKGKPPAFPFSLGDPFPHLAGSLFGNLHDFLDSIADEVNSRHKKAFKTAFPKNPYLSLLKLYAIFVLGMEIEAPELTNPLEFSYYIESKFVTEKTDSVIGLVMKLPNSPFSGITSRYDDLVRTSFKPEKVQTKQKHVPKKDNEDVILKLLSDSFKLPEGWSWKCSLTICGNGVNLQHGSTAEFDICLVGPDNVVWIIIECKSTLTPQMVEKQKKGHLLAMENGLKGKDGKYTLSRNVKLIFVTEFLSGNNSSYQAKFGTSFKNPLLIGNFGINKWGALVVNNNIENCVVQDPTGVYVGETILRYVPKK